MKKTLFTVIATLFVVSSLFITSIKLNLISLNPTESDNQITVEYKNQENSIAKIRYKYILNFETTENVKEFIPIDRPVFSIITQSGEISAFQDNYPFIPEISNVQTLLPNELSNSSFEVVLDENLVQYKEEIRIDVKIIIEQLKQNKWSPTYQVIFMERGPYWSLDKGPVEIIK